MESAVRNIALIGFMGSGKSAVGKLLARKLGYDFVDTDAEIEKQEGCLIRQIWKDKSEEYFRRLEVEVLKKVTEDEKKVIACGGGVILNPENVRRLRQNCLVVYLEATHERLYERLKYSSNRPLLNAADAKLEIGRLLAARKTIYQEVSDFAVDTTQLNVKGVVENILTRIKQEE